MPFTEQELEAIELAVRAWIQAHRWMMADRKDPSTKVYFKTDTADEILEKHGFGIDYRREARTPGGHTFVVTYYVLEKEVRARARAQKLPERRRHGKKPARLKRGAQHPKIQRVGGRQ